MGGEMRTYWKVDNNGSYTIQPEDVEGRRMERKGKSLTRREMQRHWCEKCMRAQLILTHSQVVQALWSRTNLPQKCTLHLHTAQVVIPRLLPILLALWHMVCFLVLSFSQWKILTSIEQVIPLLDLVGLCPLRDSYIYVCIIGCFVLEKCIQTLSRGANLFLKY